MNVMVDIKISDVRWTNDNVRQKLLSGKIE